MKVKYLLALIVLSFACQRENNTSNHKKDYSKSGRMYSNEKLQFQFIFPDTVYVNKSYNGKIKYKSILDTITPKFEFKKDKVSRYVNFPYVISKESLSIDELRKQKLDTLGALNNTTILLYNIKFNHVGTFFINGIIFDQAFIPIPNSETSRAISDETRATYKVVVIEK